MSAATTITNRGRAESERLTRALIELAARGQRPHCSDPGTSELWLSEHDAERAEAVRLCRGCPVIVVCGQAAAARDSELGQVSTEPEHPDERQCE